MTKEEIIMGNKLIAEFMGLRVDKTPDGVDAWFVDLENLKSIYHNQDAREPKFHSYWDWLMPVCHKLDYLAENKSVDWSADYEGYCDKLEDSITRTYTIEPVFNTVVEFIEWYNANKPAA
jgi:hypothetical protein